MSRKTLLCSLLIIATPFGASHAMNLEFDWTELELCNTGSIKIVPSPKFKVTEVPEGTATLQFNLVDLNHPDFPHGNGKVAYIGSSETIAAGEFMHIAPCPPNEVHEYQWTVIALDAQDSELATASEVQKYPPISGQ